jgi:hypothetical protein
VELLAKDRPEKIKGFGVHFVPNALFGDSAFVLQAAEYGQLPKGTGQAQSSFDHGLDHDFGRKLPPLAFLIPALLPKLAKGLTILKNTTGMAGWSRRLSGW